MSRAALRFWGSAVVGVAVFAAATALLFPYDALRLQGVDQRTRVWLLTLWTAGVLAILFGASALLAFATPLGFRDIAEAGSVREALATRRRVRTATPSFYGNFAWWLVCAGALLLVLYFLAWTSGLSPVSHP